MTIINVTIAPDRQSARCYTDDALARNGRIAGRCQKFEVLPGPAVIAWRGSAAFGHFLCMGAQAAGCADFDALVAQLPGMCRKARTDHLAAIGPLDGLSRPEVAAVGWSASDSGYRAFHLAGSQDFEVVAHQPGVVQIRPCPPGYAIPFSAIEPTRANLIAMAEAQIQQAEHEVPGSCEISGTGGSLIEIALAADGGVAVRSVHELGSYQGDPRADLQASAWWQSILTREIAA